MKLDELLEHDRATKNLRITGQITGLSADSREIGPGFAFFALQGSRQNGQLYIKDAIKNGAVAIIVEKQADPSPLPQPPKTVSLIEVDNIRRSLSLAAARFYPEQPAIITAVTGTSGKSSVVAFMRDIWVDTGFAGASIGTVGIFSPKQQSHINLTTPGPVELHQMLHGLSRESVTHLAMEASSHGLLQHRLDGVRLTAAAFTNLGRDHMDYHPTVKDYFAAKMRLFTELLPKGAPAVIFADSKYGMEAIEQAHQAKRKILSVGRKGEFIRIKRIEHERFRQFGELEYEGILYEVMLPLTGEFQMANAVVAAGLAIASGVPSAAVFRALERLKGASGRLDLVGTTLKGAPVYVDYAHKPDALENVLKAVRPFTTGRVILVFGCGGDRDRGKRPIMGEIATRLADITIVTDDNPRSEDPASIRAQILSAKGSSLEIGDRRAAIRRAVAMLQAGDCLIIAGKGHEQGQIIGTEVHEFSDHVEARAALALREEEERQ